MADFLTLQKLEEKITDIIFHAKKSLLILSPFIKLDDYFKKLFTNHIKNPEVQIIIVFGKNEDNKGKSLRKEDFEFFKQFPNVSILYLKDLHAKYYANEEEGVVTSVNLHDYSFKNNIEFGIHYKNAEHNLLGIATVKNPFSDNIDSSAWETAMGFMKQAEAVFIKRPIIQKKMFGLSTTHMGSDICFDNTEFFVRSFFNNDKVKRTFNEFPDFIEYGKATYVEKPKRDNIQTKVEDINSTKEQVPPINYNQNNYNKSYNQPYHNQNSSTAFCIRTGERIKYNLNIPYSNGAYQSWRMWMNDDYIENYCHSCGRPDETSKRRPLCQECFYN